MGLGLHKDLESTDLKEKANTRKDLRKSEYRS